MKSLEELKQEKRRLIARESLRKHSRQRDMERSKLKSEIRSLKNAPLKKSFGNISYHVRGRIGMAREKIKKIQQSVKESEKRKPKRKDVGFQGFNMKLITG